MTDPVDYRTPVDFLEPQDEQSSYREASRRFVELVNRLLIYLLRRECREKSIYAIGVALDCAFVSQDNMTDVARKFGVTRADISKESIEVRRRLSLPPTLREKPASAIAKYSQSRMRQLQ